MEAIVWLGLMSAIYAVLYILNKKTAVPESCVDNTQVCMTCNVAGCQSKIENTEVIQ